MTKIAEMTDTEFAAHWKAWARDALDQSWAMVRSPETKSARELIRIASAIAHEEAVLELWARAEKEGFDQAARRAGDWIRESSAQNTGGSFNRATEETRGSGAREWVRIAYGRYSSEALTNSIAGYL